MPSLEEAKTLIYSEITGVERAAADAFLKRYREQADRFAQLMAQAMVEWEAVDKEAIKSGDREHGRVACLIYCAITLNIQSMKLLLAGHVIAAGNLMRQVIEALAMSLLGSGKTLSHLERFDAGKYTTNGAVNDVQRNREMLGLSKEGVKALAKAEKFYHHHSHFSRLTIATVIAFEEDGFYIGASFDEGKVDGYDKEIESRMQLAEVFPNFIEAVKLNVAKW
jgi:hypothetical protein